MSLSSFSPYGKSILCKLLMISLVIWFAHPAKAQLQSTVQSADALCDSLGYAVVVPSGGSGNYSYQWSNSATSDSIGNLSAGTYYVTVYDNAMGGLDTAYVEGFDSGPHNWNLAVSTGTNAADNNFWIVNDDEGGVPVGACGAGSTGDNTLHVTNQLVAGSGAAYNAGGFCGILFCVETNLRAETPNINTTGITGMTLEFDYMGFGDGLIDNASLHFSDNGGTSFTTLDPSLKSLCCGGVACNGALQGLWTAYSVALPASAENIPDLRIGFNWTNNDDGVGTDPSFAVNNIRITYNQSAAMDSIVDTVVIVGTSSPMIDASSLAANPANCSAGNGSFVGLTVNGGTTPYTVQWDSAGTVVGNGADVSGLHTGTYNFTVTDSLGCTADTTVMMPFQDTVVLTANASMDTVCPNTNVMLSGFGGLAQGVYIWSGGDLTQPDSNQTINVQPSTNQSYQLQWTDGVCTHDTSVNVYIEPDVTISATPPTATLCPGDSVDLMAIGPAGTYYWSGGDLTQNDTSNTIRVGPVGNETYTLNYVNGGCTGDTTVSVTVSSSVNIVADASPDTICFGQTAQLSASGAVGGIYVWSGGDLAMPDTNNTISVSPPIAMTYTVNWYSGSCSATDSIRVFPFSIQAIVMNVDSPACGGNNGSILAGGTGGAGFLTITIYDTTGTVSGANNLGEGTYWIVASDPTIACTDTVEVILVDNTVFPVITDTTITGINCFGDSTGTAWIEVMGGSPPYTYSWSHDAMDNDSLGTGLTTGVTYTVSVMDQTCPVPITADLVIPGPTMPIASNATITPDNCGQGVGVIALNPSGGTPGYNFTWNPPVSGGSSANNLPAGLYTVTIEDGNMCTFLDSFLVTSQGGPSAEALPRDSICPRTSVGQVEVFVTSSDGPHSYTWSHDPTLQTGTASNLSAGLYQLTVTNNVNCDTVLNLFVYNYPGLSFDLGNDTMIVPSQVVELGVIPETGWYDPVWEPNQNIIINGFQADVFPDSSTTYWLSFAYAGGCRVSDSVRVNVSNVSLVIEQPNVFTPNGDGINDGFFLHVNEAAITFEMHVYDRWGNKVFESFDKDERWDGTNYLNGQKCGTGVYAYYFIIETFGDNPKYIDSGNVTLLR